jgi:hypothetical protein
MKKTIRLVQLYHPSAGRQVAIVQEPLLVVLTNTNSVYELALDAIKLNKSIQEVAASRLSNDEIEYDAVYEGRSAWKLLPSFDHPSNPFACLVSGTGLTHKNSALNRQMMHKAANETLTDSMKIYQWGLEGGQPESGTIGVQPEWFYKGPGSILKAHGETLESPAYADDGGEEPEVAGVYIIDQQGQPYRIGFTAGNEFSDHVMEKKNYLYLAPSKLRNCAIGPEILIEGEFKDITGTVEISRANTQVWSQDIQTGENNMAHSLENLEYHHFKYAAHRIPLQAHVHFFGADAFSFGKGIALENGDTMHVHWKGLGRPLQNILSLTTETAALVKVKIIG